MDSECQTRVNRIVERQNAKMCSKCRSFVIVQWKLLAPLFDENVYGFDKGMIRIIRYQTREV